MPGLLHVSRRLTNASLMFKPDFTPLGDKFFLEKPTDFLTDQFAQFSKAGMLGLRDVSPVGEKSPLSKVRVLLDADKTFSINLYGLTNEDEWVTNKNSDQSVEYDVQRTMWLTSAMRTAMEYLRVNKRLRDTSVMTTNKTLTTAEQWDNATSGSALPITLLQSYVDQIADNNQGKGPNVAGCARQLIRAIQNSEEFTDKVKYTRVPTGVPDDWSKSDIGAVWLIEEMVGLPHGSLHVHDATYNAGTLAAPSYKKFIGGDFVMAYVEPLTNMSYTACVGWRWSAVPAENSILEVPNYQTTIPTVDYRIINATEPQVVKPELAVLLKGCVNVNDAKYGGKLD